MASNFLPRTVQEDMTGSHPPTCLAEEDLFVASNEGLLVRHRLSLLRAQQQLPASPIKEVPDRFVENQIVGWSLQT